jgi:hypothetical protein
LGILLLCTLPGESKHRLPAHTVEEYQGVVMSRYIIEASNSGNPRILELQGDATYKCIAFGAGDNSLDAIKEMTENANRFVIQEIIR